MIKENYNKKIKGELFYQVIDKNGNILEEHNQNMILDNAGKVLARIKRFGKTNPDVFIKNIVFGTNQAESIQTTTALSGNTLVKELDHEELIEPNIMKYYFTLEELDFNGNDIWQFALSTGDGELFSMFSRYPTFETPIAKVDDVLVIGWWQLTFDVINIDEDPLTEIYPDLDTFANETLSGDFNDRMNHLESSKTDIQTMIFNKTGEDISGLAFSQYSVKIGEIFDEIDATITEILGE